MKLFELEVPEIDEGIVRIESCAREPGHRAKIAVSSMDRDVDPVGACVGLKGSRVQAVVQELRGEAIDIIPFHPDPARFIVYAIAPAQVSRVYIDELAHSMELIVPDDQLSKAIGRRGQNVRLAAQLTGWRIDIFSESRHGDMVDRAHGELERIAILKEGQVDELIRHGFRSAQELYDAEAYEVAGILEISEDDADDVIDAAEDLLDLLIGEEAERKAEAERAALEAPEVDESVPADADDVVPADADDVVPADVDDVVPAAADESVPAAADESVPEAADEPAPEV
jgi:N utilization substance protein A